MFCPKCGKEMKRTYPSVEGFIQDGLFDKYWYCENCLVGIAEKGKRLYPLSVEVKYVDKRDI